LKEKQHLKVVIIDGRITLKLIFKGEKKGFEGMN
jgi:hypothetical protein